MNNTKTGIRFLRSRPLSGVCCFVVNRLRINRLKVDSPRIDGPRISIDSFSRHTVRAYDVRKLLSSLVFTSVKLVFLSTLVSCGGGSVDSEDLKTTGFHATIRITATEDITRVDARLTAGGPNGSDIELSSTDFFTASGYGQTLTLTREPQFLGLYDSYVGEFNFNEGEERIELSLNRGPDDVDAQDTYVSIPAAILLTSGAEEEEVNIADILTITWEDNGDLLIDVVVSLDCPAVDATNGAVGKTNLVSINDEGRYSVNFDTLLSSAERAMVDEGAVCLGFVTLEREAQGVLDSNFDGGYIEAIQSTTKYFNVTI